MNRRCIETSRIVGLVFAAVMLFTAIGRGVCFAGADADGSDKTLSPYFFVKSEDPSIDRLPLKSTSATVTVSGVVADVVVVQVYKNEGKKSLEALYVFPASTRAAVYGMKMTIGERTITATIKKREEARHDYEQAKAEGKSASLLEQQRPNVFQMNVAGIQPGDEIRTELRYTEILTPTDGVYEFVYPTVVGPRYSNQPAASAPPSEKWSQNPYLHEGEEPPYAFDIKADVASGVPLREMTCPSHKTEISYKDQCSAQVRLDPSEKSGGNRDFILKYRLAGEAVGSGMLLYQGEKENFFLLMMQPPRRVVAEDVPAREYIFIVDVSGSMNGFPIDISKKLLKDLVSGLRPKDRFDILLFSGGSRLFSERSVAATSENIRNAVEFLNKPDGSGGTELLPALRRVMTIPQAEGVSRTYVVATDGYVTVEPEIFDLIRENLGKANFFAFGIGTSVNRHIIEGMACMGAGEPFVVAKAGDAPGMAEKFRQYVLHPVLTKVRVGFGDFQVYDVEPPNVPDVFAERPVMMMGKWKGNPRGTVTMTGIGGQGPFKTALDLSKIKPSAQNAALGTLWARSRIAALSDYNQLKATDERTARITSLGLGYNLLTAYTSFVAVDTVARGQGRETATVVQPLPLPQGVSDLAVGRGGTGHAPTSPVRMKRSTSMPVELYASTGVSTAGTTGTTSGAKGSSPILLDVFLKGIKVSGELTEDDMKLFFDEHSKEIADCFLSAQVKLTAIVELTWTVKGDGRIVDMRASVGDRKLKGVTDCLVKKASGWASPKPTDGRRAFVSVTVGFQK